MNIYDFLKTNKIEYKPFNHPPVYTCEEAKNLKEITEGVGTKNLFLRDKKGKRHFLVVTKDNKNLDLNALAKLIKVNRLSMASSERLMKYLKIEPGSVSLLALVNDLEKQVEVIIDKEVWSEESIQCHPLVNTSTLVIRQKHLEKFLSISKHNTITIDLPPK